MNNKPKIPGKLKLLISIVFVALTVVLLCSMVLVNIFDNSGPAAMAVQFDTTAPPTPTPTPTPMSTAPQTQTSATTANPRTTAAADPSSAGTSLSTLPPAAIPTTTGAYTAPPATAQPTATTAPGQPATTAQDTQAIAATSGATTKSSVAFSTGQQLSTTPSGSAASLLAMYFDPTPLGRSDMLQRLTAPITTAASDDYFTDALFVGDSVSVGFQNYITAKRKSSPDFYSNSFVFAIASFQSGYAISSLDNSKNIHPLYNGEKAQVWDVAKALGSKRIYIMFGLNEVATYTPARIEQNYTTLVADIRAAVPDAVIIFLATTPMTKDGEKPSLTNTIIDQHNTQMIGIADELDCWFIDMNTPLKSSDGYLPDSFSSDDYCHLTMSAYNIWDATLRDHQIPLMGPHEAWAQYNAGVQVFAAPSN